MKIETKLTLEIEFRSRASTESFGSPIPRERRVERIDFGETTGAVCVRGATGHYDENVRKSAINRHCKPVRHGERKRSRHFSSPECMLFNLVCFRFRADFVRRPMIESDADLRGYAQSSLSRDT